jgi:hypothetical protein
LKKDVSNEINRPKYRVSYEQYCSSSRASSEAINVASENGDQEFKFLLEEKEKEISVRHLKLVITNYIQYTNNMLTGSNNQF